MKKYILTIEETKVITEHYDASDGEIIEEVCQKISQDDMSYRAFRKLKETVSVNRKVKAEEICRFCGDIINDGSVFDCCRKFVYEKQRLQRMEVKVINDE